MQRQVKNIHNAIEAHMPGLSTYQALPNQGVEYLDPFILLNHHGPETFAPNNAGLPFGPHPHRGFETLTFVFAGDIVHEDSTGKKHKSAAGGVQWMTAGKGIIHSEVSSEEFKKNGGEEEVLQLWMNLPAKLKMVDPAYEGYHAHELATLNGEGYSVHIVSGEIQGKQGPHDSISGLTLSYVRLNEGATFKDEIPEGRTIFLYVVKGTISVDGEQAQRYQLVQMGQEGSALSLSAEEDSIILYGHGEPLNEPKVAQGPFVMNSVGELKQAFLDYQEGKFV